MRKYAGGSLASTTIYKPASALNQMLGWRNGETNAVYTYDANGNRQDKFIIIDGENDATNYEYDEDNRLVKVILHDTEQPKVYSFAYDYRTRRIQRETPTEKTLHVFDGGLSVQEYLVEATPSSLTLDNLTTESIRGEGMGGGVGGMVYSVRNGQIEASHSNHRGDVVARTDNTGNLTWFARYHAYGTRFHEVGATYDRQRGNTKDEEEPLSLSFQGMRPLGLEHGVWLTPDPIGISDGPNRYLYVHNNPITGFDPLGLTMEYTTSRAKVISNYVMEHGSDQNKAELQGLIDSDRSFTMGTTDRQFGGKSEFTPDTPNAFGKDGEAGEKSGGHINIEVSSGGSEFSLESSAAHEIRHASDSDNGLLTEHNPDKLGFDVDQNGYEDNEDRAVESQREFQKANGVKDDDLRESYGDTHKGLSDKGFLEKMYNDDQPDA